MGASGESASDLLIAAFLSMQLPKMLVSFAREVGGGVVSEMAQQFFLDKCFNNEVQIQFPASHAYLKNAVKQIILAAERDGQEVLEDLYGVLLVLLNSDKGLPLPERCYKTFTFMIPECAQRSLRSTLGNEVASEVMGKRLVTIRVSLDMLDGDTGYSVWPAGLFLAEVLLSHPQLVHGKSCLELGSGTGICSIWLSMLAPSKAVITDGAWSTLVNLRHNLAINGIPVQENNEETSAQGSNKTTHKVHCRQLLWELVSKDEVQAYNTQVIIGADLIYDPTIVPNLVRVLGIMLQWKSSDGQGCNDYKSSDEVSMHKSQENEGVPVAYIASALRNLTTLHLFFRLAANAGLEVVDVTETLTPIRILSAIHIFDRFQIRLFKVVSGSVMLND